MKLVTGRSRCCHLDQIRLREGNVEFPSSYDSPDVEIPETPSDADDKPHDQSLELEQPGDMTRFEPDESSTSDHSTDVGTGHPATVVKHYPRRIRNSVQRYEPIWT